MILKNSDIYQIRQGQEAAGESRGQNARGEEKKDAKRG